ncbi:MAG TPA: tRNA (N6-threonylcarbamoyladenosine(37)-N6)-methyltransferase TrmO [Deltaproteobacteria bacterium]|jgi:tRNA-Thr(GGU) m(6)t(6)A37 methyltransferase TsaA|nr:tRNA (N6-threonylcarbamoyladenosine(37)-N6)-methyltransferase TrmO [Deltaproteobacteria bacterium]HQH99901.1 tRNA (N6-threonylcarbamoyladenosine(37)-N6)-methyltransferase TrmO [Deltaproteobacteria bacterium]HQJ07740.1 tRNA (N6-threonylcarbamoyladenosine(37)-N6)-methyltransferase TrmO [Deltaproteobacteria bacterium]
MTDTIVCRPVGTIRSEHRIPEETPVQPEFAKGCAGRAEVFPEYEEGLRDIETFSHLILLYSFHKAGDPELIIKPFLDDVPRGIFATRHPSRPNRIGLSVVRLIRREGPVLILEDVDVLDGTPIIDIKPYVPRFDAPGNATGGWTDTIDPRKARQRGRRMYGSREILQKKK